MLHRRHILGLALLGASMSLGGCNSAPRTIRYRLTLFVDTPEGLRSGSSVVEKTVSFQDFFLGGMVGNKLIVNVRGEATVVDLGTRGLLFCLLSADPTRRESRNAEYIVQEAFPMRPLDRQDNADKAIARYYDDLNRMQPKTELSFEHLPMLVRFRDIDDPKTVERVDPDDLAKSFGLGVKLSNATMEITGNSITRGIEKKLRWLDYLDRYRTDPNNPFTNTLPKEVGALRRMEP